MNGARFQTKTHGAVTRTEATALCFRRVHQGGQVTVRVAYQGEPGAFSEAAVLRLLELHQKRQGKTAVTVKLAQTARPRRRAAGS